MKRLVLAAVCGVLAAAGLAGAPGAAAQTATHPARNAQWHAAVRACAPATRATATCFAHYRAPVNAAAAQTIDGITALDVRAAYGLPASGGYRGTVAIVDAQDAPTAEKDLAVYRKKFGLPPCTSANGCFRKVNQRGKAAPLPDPDPQGWGVEIELDLQAVSAACPGCRLLLVEGDSPSTVDLGTAVNTAVRLGATVVSNSYGLDEFYGMQPFGAKYYQHPGVPIVVSSGDYGFTAAQFPAVLPYAIAVGGTTLTRATGTARGYTERVWDSGGSGCSAYVAKPSWQKGTGSHCLERTVADVAAVADGYAVYDSDLGPDSGWIVVSGTSVSAPLISGMVARSDHHGLSNAAWLYAHRSAFFDITSGSNGFCGGDYLCTGKPGYDAPTGVGTPKGLAGL